MRVTLLLGAITLAISSTAEAAPSNRSCLQCHQAPLFDPEALARSVHAKLDCADCHKGYDFHLHRAKAPDWKPAEAALIARLADVSTAPAAIAACGRCHESQRDDAAASVHGRWLREVRPASGPTCLACHGSPHAIQKVDAKDSSAVAVQRQVYAARCSKCHEDKDLVRKAGLSEHPGPSFRDSVHGRMIELGNPRAPGCANCHGAHDIAPARSADSAVFGDNKIKTCAECHKGATANFAATFTHQPLTRVSRPVPHTTALLFSWLTSLVLTGLVLHLGLDFGADARLRLRRRRGLEPPKAAAAPSSVVRFDRHQLVQHWLLISSVLVLVFSDFPLRAAGVGASHSITQLLGGVHRAGLVHRTAGVVLGIAGLYHLVYLTVLAVRRKLAFSMLPSLKDLTDLFQNAAYFTGLRKERPRFPRFSYAEKFDYWAVFWGVAVMFGTGLMRWFPVWFAKFIPARILEAAQIAHGDEATLAALVLFVWHLYNVHLRPGIFPMSWIWLDGRIEVETLREEHGAEYDALVAAGKLPKAPDSKP